MLKTLSLIILSTVYFGSAAQIPSTKVAIQKFIDSIGNSNDRANITTSLLPAFTDGSNPKWLLKMWHNKNNELLWVNTIVPDSFATTFFYCQDILIFVSELTYTSDSATNKRKPVFRNIYMNQSEIIDDSAPGRNNNTAEYYIDESKKYLTLFKSR
jgi:hypothetical protein